MSYHNNSFLEKFPRIFSASLFFYIVSVETKYSQNCLNEQFIFEKRLNFNPSSQHKILIFLPFCFPKWISIIVVN